MTRPHCQKVALKKSGDVSQSTLGMNCGGSAKNNFVKLIRRYISDAKTERSNEDFRSSFGSLHRRDIVDQELFDPPTSSSMSKKERNKQPARQQAGRPGGAGSHPAWHMRMHHGRGEGGGGTSSINPPPHTRYNLYTNGTHHCSSSSGVTGLPTVCMLGLHQV